MSTYTVRSTTTQTGLASTTAVVLIDADAPIPGRRWLFATVALDGTTFSFYDAPTDRVVAVVPLAQTTLAAAVAGCSVLIADSDSRWYLGTVVGDGDSVHVDGAAVDASTPASAPITTPPAAGTALTLLGTASDSTLWFSATSGKLYHGAAVSTLGALAHGAMFAKIGDAWAVVVV